MRVAVALLFLGITAAYSQTQSVDRHKAVVFSGNVTDITGANIPKAIISLEGSDGTNLRATTDENGKFTIEGPPGDYILKVTAQAFFTHKESIHLADTTSIKKDIALTVASCPPGPCIEVTRIEPAVETLNIPLTATLPLTPLPPLKLHKHLAR